MSNGKLMLMKTAALLFVPLMLIATGVAQTRPLSVCDIVKHTGDWDNNVVLIPVITTVEAGVGNKNPPVLAYCFR